MRNGALKSVTIWCSIEVKAMKVLDKPPHSKVVVKSLIYNIVYIQIVFL